MAFFLKELKLIPGCAEDEFYYSVSDHELGCQDLDNLVHISTVTNGKAEEVLLLTKEDAGALADLLYDMSNS
jgi:hypothetical protein